MAAKVKHPSLPLGFVPINSRVGAALLARREGRSVKEVEKEVLAGAGEAADTRADPLSSYNVRITINNAKPDAYWHLSFEEHRGSIVLAQVVKPKVDYATAEIVPHVPHSRAQIIYLNLTPDKKPRTEVELLDDEHEREHGRGVRDGDDAADDHDPTERDDDYTDPALAAERERAQRAALYYEFDPVRSEQLEPYVRAIGGANSQAYLARASIAVESLRRAAGLPAREVPSGGSSRARRESISRSSSASSESFSGSGSSGTGSSSDEEREDQRSKAAHRASARRSSKGRRRRERERGRSARRDVRARAASKS